MDAQNPFCTTTSPIMVLHGSKWCRNLSIHSIIVVALPVSTSEMGILNFQGVCVSIDTAGGRGWGGGWTLEFSKAPGSQNPFGSLAVKVLNSHSTAPSLAQGGFGPCEVSVKANIPLCGVPVESLKEGLMGAQCLPKDVVYHQHSDLLESGRSMPGNKDSAPLLKNAFNF